MHPSQVGAVSPYPLCPRAWRWSSCFLLLIANSRSFLPHNFFKIPDPCSTYPPTTPFGYQPSSLSTWLECRLYISGSCLLAPLPSSARHLTGFQSIFVERKKKHKKMKEREKKICLWGTHSLLPPLRSIPPWIRSGFSHHRSCPVSFSCLCFCVLHNMICQILPLSPSL